MMGFWGRGIIGRKGETISGEDEIIRQTEHRTITSDPRQLWSKVKILVLGFVLFCQLWFEEPDKETHQSET